MNNVVYETEAVDTNNNRCPIQLQRETPTGLVDTTCGSEVQPKQAGLCKYVHIIYIIPINLLKLFNNYTLLNVISLPRYP